MIMTFGRFRRLSLVVLAAGAVASCGQMASSQLPVQSSNPSVTYNYRTDGELLTANQNATTFCGQYQTSPRTSNITNNSDGSKTVVFECMRTAYNAPAPGPAYPQQSYTYRTDHELMQASHSAGAYCQRHGSQPMTSNTVINSDGSRTATFYCGPR